MVSFICGVDTTDSRRVEMHVCAGGVSSILFYLIKLVIYYWQLIQKNAPCVAQNIEWHFLQKRIPTGILARHRLHPPGESGY